MIKWLTDLLDGKGEVEFEDPVMIKRAPRVSNLSMQGVFVHNGVNWEILNISTTGMALKVPEGSKLGKGDLEGELVFDSMRFAVRAKVARQE